MTTQAGSEYLISEVLRVAAQATEPIGRFDIVEALEEAGDMPAEGTREDDALLEQRIAIIGAAVSAEQTGFLECVRPANGGDGDFLQISQSGRAWLEAASKS